MLILPMIQPYYQLAQQANLDRYRDCLLRICHPVLHSIGGITKETSCTSSLQMCGWSHLYCHRCLAVQLTGAEETAP